MPRRPRLDLPDCSQHVMQRGVDRQPMFFADDDSMEKGVRPLLMFVCLCVVIAWRSVGILDNDNMCCHIWRVPEPLPPSVHPFKYRLVYVEDGKRVVGFDNERGKGDHKHIGETEFPYQFATVDQLLEDFFVEVEKWKTER